MKNAVRVLVVMLVVVAGMFIYEYRKAASLNNRAVALIDQKRYEEAIDLLKAARARYPDNLTILKNLAKTCYEIGDKENALEAYMTILGYSPDDVEAKRRVEQIRNPEPLRKRANARLERMRLEGWKDDGMDFDVMLQMVEKSLENKDVRNAILYLERALFVDRDNLELEQRIEELEALYDPGRHIGIPLYGPQ